MQTLRWKSRYRSGNADNDRHNKAVVECLNTLIEAARRRDHCHEIEELLDSLAEHTDTLLSSGEDAETVRRTLRDTLLGHVPLPNYQTQSCHACGICDLARRQVSEHLEAPALCLAIKTPPA